MLGVSAPGRTRAGAVDENMLNLGVPMVALEEETGVPLVLPLALGVKPGERRNDCIAVVDAIGERTPA